jgi:deoxyribodipyrimidine photolyase-related protein
MLKLAYHRATMKKYYDYLKSKDINVHYINFDKATKSFYKSLKEVTFYDPYDNKLFKKLDKIVKCNILEQKQFIISNDEIINNKDKFYSNGKYRNDLFYKFMRIKLDILINKGKPEGGKWSFDSENRLSLPKGIEIPDLPKVKHNEYIEEAVNYVKKNFNNYGSLDNFIYPIDHKSSINWLNNFSCLYSDFGSGQILLSNNLYLIKFFFINLIIFFLFDKPIIGKIKLPFLFRYFSKRGNAC